MLHIYNDPNSTEYWHEPHDIPGKNIIGENGLDGYTKHLKQDKLWGDNSVVYKFNSLGFRGIEPDYSNENRILFAGGCLSFGTGINIEDTYAYKFSKLTNSSYINISESKTIMELLDLLHKYITEFKPKLIVISDTRFFDEIGPAIKNILELCTDRKQFMETINIVRARNINQIKLFLHYLETTYKTPVYFIATKRKDFNHMGNMKSDNIILLHTKDMLDLARDNYHPGVLTHSRITNKLYERTNHIYI
jgi:hypothetical protein